MLVLDVDENKIFVSRYSAEGNCDDHALSSCDRASWAKCEGNWDDHALGSCDRASWAKCEGNWNDHGLGSCDRASWAKCEERKTNKMQQLDV